MQPLSAQQFRSGTLQGSPRPGDQDIWTEQLASLVTATNAWCSTDGLDASDVARATCAYFLRHLWDRASKGDRSWLPQIDVPESILPIVLRRQVQTLAADLVGASWIEVGYRIGGIYTRLLPAEVRSSLGVYYTPPELAERLLDLAGGEGADWASWTVLDPACGGGAFLVPVAQRIISHHQVRQLTAEAQLLELERRLAGIEIDPFAAWMTRTLLRLLAYPLSVEARRPLDVEIEVADALGRVVHDERRFDLVVGNPPYGRIRLSDEQREEFSRSLYGHANLYGVFLDAALRWRSNQGLIAFVTPTSLLGGRYFHRLRSLLLAEAPPLILDIVQERTGVFEAVQQETCLTLFGSSNGHHGTTVHHLRTRGGQLDVRRTGVFEVGDGASRGHPWLLPRTPRQAPVVKAAAKTDTRLHHLGYKASTGPLVWNRYKDQLRDQPGASTYPLIWAEAVRPNQFDFAYRVRSHAPFFEVEPGQEHLCEERPGVLVQRTTAKEQRRRIIACAIPPHFFECWETVVVENHVNILRPRSGAAVDGPTLAAVLNTRVVDQIFRCLSGTVAVSASELHSLPLPSRETFDRIAALIEENGRGACEPVIERLVAEDYGLEGDV